MRLSTISSCINVDLLRSLIAGVKNLEQDLLYEKNPEIYNFIQALYRADIPEIEQSLPRITSLVASLCEDFEKKRQHFKELPDEEKGNLFVLFSFLRSLDKSYRIALNKSLSKILKYESLLNSLL